MRYLITFSYNGKNFNGYQKQPNKNTIQDKIEFALSKITNLNVIIHASGRTDRGVHALNQTAHFDLEKTIDLEKFRYSLNSLIGDDIYIKKIEQVNDNFHARFNIKEKEYIYKINIGEYNPIEKDYVLQYNKPLDIDSMIEASKYLIGKHNFKSFSKTDIEREDFVREIYSIDFIINEDLLTISFKGSGFLRYMVRNMVGTLIEVGENRRKSIEIKNILDNENRIYAGKTANPEGLYLKSVKY